MNHKIKRLWCAALRGGHWTQIKKHMHDEGLGRCALGVLDEVLRELEGPAYQGIGQWRKHNMPRDDYNNIMLLNDVADKSFPEIADWIEEKWSGKSR